MIDLEKTEMPEPWLSVIANAAIAVAAGVLIWWLLDWATPHLEGWRLALVSW